MKKKSFIILVVEQTLHVTGTISRILSSPHTLVVPYCPPVFTKLDIHILCVSSCIGVDISVNDNLF